MKNRVTLIFILISIFSTNLKSQIVASQTESCVGEAFQFTYQNGNGLTGISWDFGDGAGAQDSLTVSHSYSESGTYNVTFTANGASDNIQIIVHPNPIANFSGGGVGCITLDVAFSDMSIGGDGAPIVSWTWNFGDGGMGSGANPTHSYTLPGVFSVSLEVVDANGCRASQQQSNIVSTSPRPDPVISTDPTPPVACVPPLDVTFSGANSHSNSPSDPSLTYQWSFGNGNTGNTVGPITQTYDELGTFTVFLTVTDNNGCSDFTSVDVEIHNPVAGFEVGDTVCKQMSVVDTSTGGTSLWNFGDSPTFTTGVNHTYDDTGTYVITQIVTIPGTTCRDTVKDTIYVEKPHASFTIDPYFTCDVYSPNNIIHFDSSPSSSDVDSVFWDFGLDAISSSIVYGHYHGSLDTSTLFNPTDTIVFVGNEYSINSLDSFETCLTVFTSHGCPDDTCIVHYIQKPNALFFTDKTEGCAPLIVEFSDSSNTYGNIVSFEWFWGDGTSYIGGPNDNIVTHTYNNAGEYDSYLVITTENGCTDTSYFRTIYVGESINPTFTVSNTTVCPQDTVYFNTTDPNVDSWHFTTDEGLMTHCSENNTPYWQFHSATGTQDVTLTSCYNGCCTDNTIQDMVTVLGPICKIDNYTMDCDSPFVFQFDGHIDGADSWQWNLGDGTIVSGLTNLSDTLINHTYPSVGDYKVILTATNSTSGCSDYSDTITIHVRDIKAAMKIDSLLCLNIRDTFNSAPSVDAEINEFRGFYWDFGDTTRAVRSSDTIVMHKYIYPGTYTVMLIAKDINQCTDTVYQNVNVYGVYAGFKVDSLYGCKPEFGVNFTDTSRFDYSDSLYSWHWYFDDGYVSNQPHPHHQFVYDDIPIFNVKLVVEDSIGCKDSLIKPIEFSIPDPRFTYTPSNKICVNDSVGFRPISQDTLIFAWNFGDNDTTYYLDSINNIFYHTYTYDSLYTVWLSVTDSLGCIEYDTLSSNISVQSYPDAAFFTDPDINTALCFGNDIIFTDTTVSKYSYNRHWDLGNGSPVLPDSIVSMYYQQRGAYNISLISTTSNGCSDTISAVLDVVGAQADLSFSPQVICKGQDVTFNVSNMTDVFYYYFDFGDGINTDTIPVDGQTSIDVSHTYNYGPESGQTLAQLIIYSVDTLCPVIIDTTVYINPVIAKFTRNNETEKTDTAHCLHITDIFNSSSSINADVVSWSFGDGSTAGNIISPEHEYTQAGTYYVTLHIVDNETGCTDTLSKQMIIFPKPEISAQGGFVCYGNSFQLGADSLNGTYVWEPSDNMNNPNIYNPIVTPEHTEDYTLYFSDENDCKDTVTATIFVQLPPEEWIRDTTLIIGETLNLNGEQDGGYTYTWSPDTNITCVNCPNPIANPQEDITYYLVMQDTMGCDFIANNQYNIEVLPVSSVDVPDVFTPNGDGVNDRIYVKGWGIKRLIEFSIYNRWGEKVYTSTDINEGWDGTFKGKPQNVDSYAYFVKVETYIDPHPITKKGTFTLIR